MPHGERAEKYGTFSKVFNIHGRLHFHGPSWMAWCKPWTRDPRYRVRTVVVSVSKATERYPDGRFRQVWNDWNDWDGGK